MDLLSGFILIVLVIGFLFTISVVVENINNSKEVIEELKNDREKILLKKMEVEQNLLKFKIENSKLLLEIEKIKKGGKNGIKKRYTNKNKK